MSYAFVRDNGIQLNVIKTSPNNIILRKIDNNVVYSGHYGINGSFFDFSTRALLSIAVQDDIPVNGAKGEYGSGWFNTRYSRGTLVWDEVARKYSVQVVDSADQIQVTDRGSYWAQGGVSMSLQDDANWESIAEQQNMPNKDGLTTRTGLVWNSGLNIWLVVTPDLCTAAQFRNSVKNLASGTIVDGIFLDAGGSSQILCKEYSYKGDGRDVVQMVGLTTV